MGRRIFIINKENTTTDFEFHSCVKKNRHVNGLQMQLHELFDTIYSILLTIVAVAGSECVALGMSGFNMHTAYSRLVLGRLRSVGRTSDIGSRNDGHVCADDAGLLNELHRGRQ